MSFFIAVSRLNTIRRTGWVWRNVPNPETIAEHSFRLAFLAWTLGTVAGLQTKKMIAMAVLHDICEAYTGDLTPYYGIVPHDGKKRKAMLQRWIRLPQSKKASLVKARVAMEKKALSKLVKDLDPKTRASVFLLWQDFENGLSPEGRFVKQLDKIEAMLQAIEYFGTGPNTPVVGWWEEVEELVDHPVLTRFVKSIEEHLYYKKKSEFDGTLEFLYDVGKLKRKPRPIWLLRKVKEPNSEANHLFLLAVMTWILSKEKKPGLSVDRVLKLALACRLGFVHQQKGATTYDKALRGLRTDAQKTAALAKWIRDSVGEKKKLFLSSYTQEKKSLQKLVARLEPRLKKEILYAWEEFKQNRTAEARFVNQVYMLESLLRALQYWEQDKKFSIEPWWEWAFESSDNSLSQEFLELLEERFRQPLPKKKTGRAHSPRTIPALRTRR